MINISFPPNINPQLFALSAVAVGAVLVDGFTSDELNAIGNWLLLVGQYVEVVTAQQQLIQGRIEAANKSNTNNDQSDKNDSNATDKNNTDNAKDDKDNKNDKNDNNCYESSILLDMIQRMKNEIESIQKEMQSKSELELNKENSEECHPDNMQEN